MDEEMAIDMADVKREVDSQFKNANDAISENAKRYVELLHYSIEFEKRKELLFLNLSETEKEEAQQAIKKTMASNLPEYMPVAEVAEMLQVSPQMVRRYCANGDIIAKQRLERSGKWLIPTEQFLARPEFANYLKQKEVNKIKSINAARIMLEMIEDDDED